MRSESSPIGQEATRTFTETARRAQIVAAAIDTIAELGYGQASLARIAETAGTSKGVIIYHFGGKDELIRELVARVWRTWSPRSMPSRPAPASCGPTSSPTWPSWARTATIWSRSSRSRSTPEPPTAAGSTTFRVQDAGVAALQQLLAYFQGTGEFRAGFDPHVMAMAIRAAINAVPAQLARDPALDIGHHAREIADMFLIATRPGEAPRDQQSPEE